MFIPARTICSSTSGDSDAGPIVATILVLWFGSSTMFHTSRSNGRRGAGHQLDQELPTVPLAEPNWHRISGHPDYQHYPHYPLSISEYDPPEILLLLTVACTQSAR